MAEKILLRPSTMPSAIGLTKKEYEQAMKEHEKLFDKYAEDFEKNFPELVTEFTTDDE